MTSYHVLGQIPNITFVRDDSRAHYMQVEQLLAVADFGPEFIPTKYSTSIRDNIYIDPLKDRPSGASKLQEEFHKISLQLEEESTLEVSQTAMSSRVSSLHCVLRNNMLEPCSQTPSHSEVFLETKSAAESGSSETLASHILPSSVTHLSRNSDMSQFQSAPASQSVLVNASEEALDAMKKTENNFITKTICKNTKEKLSFRDDIYGVPYTELMNKILICKQKSKTRPTIIQATDSQDIDSSRLDMANWRSLIHKQVKKRKDLSLQLDHRMAELEDGTNIEDEEDENWDDDDEEDVYEVQNIDENLDTK